MDELDNREKYLFELFRDDDKIWNADTIRGKLTEIEYFRNIPKTVIASILLEELNQGEVRKDGTDN